MRTAPRDAMISLTAPEKDMGLAFGVHRAMDTAGAMIGPLSRSRCWPPRPRPTGRCS